jgi:hypothetical protein
MKKTILATALVCGVISSSALAYGGPNNMAAPCPQTNTQMQQGQKYMRMNKAQGCNMQMQGNYKKGSHMRRGAHMMLPFYKLNLSDEQRYKISLLRDEMRLEMKKARGMRSPQSPMLQFIGKKGFDTNGYKKYMSQRSEKMLNIKATYMQKIFDTLSKEQIATLTSSSK